MKQLNAFLRRFLRQSAGIILLTFLLDLLANGLGLAIPLLLAQAYTRLFGLGSARGRLLEQWGLAWPNSFEHWMYLLGACILAKLLADLRREQQRGALGEAFIYGLRSLLFRHQLRLHHHHYEEKGSGRFLLRFSGDLNSVQNLVTKGIIRFSGDLTLVLLGLALIFWMDIRLGAVIFGALSGLGLIIGRINHKAGLVEEKRRNKKSGLLAYVSHLLQKEATLKAFNLEEPLLGRFERRTEGLKSLGIVYYRWAAAAGGAITFGIYFAIWLTLMASATIKAGAETFDSGKLFALILILLSWRGLLSRMYQVGLIWKKGAISWKKLANLLEKNTESNFDKPLSNLPAFPLKAQGLGLALEGRNLFSGIDEALFPGDLLLVYGVANSGKTSFCKMLAGINLPSEGSLCLGDTDIRAAHPKAWRRRLTFISDSFPLLGQTVFEAISYGQSKRHRERALRLLADWQEKFPVLQPVSLDSRLGDGTGRLSQSQIRLLMWMRAVLSRKKIIVADEPWAGLDRELAEALASWLKNLQKDYIWIMLSADPQAASRFGIPVKSKISLGQPEPAEI